MLQVTTDAASYLVNIRRERGVKDSAGARFVGNAGRVGLTFAPAPEAGDRVVDGAVIKVFVAADIAETLDQSIIDARQEDGRTSLVLRKQVDASTKAANPTS